MAWYFFDVRNNGTLICDDVGLELDDLKAAVGEAAFTLAEKTEEMVEGSLRQELAIEVRDDLGVFTLKVTLSLELFDPTARLNSR